MMAATRYLRIIKRQHFHFSGAFIIVIGAKATIVVAVMVSVVDVSVAVILGKKQR
jgi:hypothetical protein